MGRSLRRMIMELCCKRCGSAKQVKNGLMRGKQRYLCKGCGLSFTDTPPRGKPLALKCRWHAVCPVLVAHDLSGLCRRDRMLPEVRMARIIDAIGLHQARK